MHRAVGCCLFEIHDHITLADGQIDRLTERSTIPPLHVDLDAMVRDEESLVAELVQQMVEAERSGYDVALSTSIMVDGSHLEFDRNVALTNWVVETAGPYGASVEAGLGMVADHIAA